MLLASEENNQAKLIRFMNSASLHFNKSKKGVDFLGSIKKSVFGMIFLSLLVICAISTVIAYFRKEEFIPIAIIATLILFGINIIMMDYIYYNAYKTKVNNIIEKLSLLFQIENQCLPKNYSLLTNLNQAMAALKIILKMNTNIFSEFFLTILSIFIDKNRNNTYMNNKTREIQVDSAKENLTSCIANLSIFLNNPINYSEINTSLHISLEALLEELDKISDALFYYKYSELTSKNK